MVSQGSGAFSCCLALSGPEIAQLGLDPATDALEIGAVAEEASIVGGEALADDVAVEAESGLPRLSMDDKQFGSKVGKHAEDFGLDPKDPATRDFVRARINDIHDNPDEIRQGEWNPKSGDGNDHLFYRQGADVLVTGRAGNFVTILKDGELMDGSRGPRW